MMRTVRLLQVVLPLLVILAQPLRAEEIRLSEDLQVYPLTEHSWVHRSWAQVNGRRYPSNGLILQDGDTLILVDTAWGDAPTALLLDWIEQQFGKLPDEAYMTHSHADRMGGARQLAEHGIPAWVHPKTLAIAKREADIFYDPARPSPLAIAAFAKGDRVTLGSLELFYPGPAHSPDNIVIWFPKDQLLIGGCAVKGAGAPAIGYVPGSDAQHWGPAMERVLAQYPDARIVVPGHGEVGDLSLVTHTRDLAERGQAAHQH